MTTIFINDGSILKSISSITMFSNPLFLVMDLLLLLLLLFRITTTSIQRQHRWQFVKKFVQRTSMNWHRRKYTYQATMSSPTSAHDNMHANLFFEKKNYINLIRIKDIISTVSKKKKRNSLDTCPIHTNTRGAKCISFLYSMLDFADIYTYWFFLSKFVK